MILSYDSILGIPIINSSDTNSSNTNSSDTNTSNKTAGFNLGILSILVLGVIIILFVVLFSNLGKTESSSDNTTNGYGKLFTILIGGVVIAVFLLNGLQYFFNINLTAQINNLFSSSPSIDLIVAQPQPSSKTSPLSKIRLKEQVYHIPGNKFTYDNADALCQAYGSRLATYSEVENSYKKGGEWCSYGWSDNQLALFPTQKNTWDKLQNIEGHENDCGRPGINGGYIANPNVRFGVNCYGYKPRITQEEKDLMNSQPLYPRTLDDIKEEKQIDFWRQKIPEILVAPFNKNVWSLI